jgi:hypothetical protein
VADGGYNQLQRVSAKPVEQVLEEAKKDLTGFTAGETEMGYTRTLLCSTLLMASLLAILP